MFVPDFIRAHYKILIGSYILAGASLESVLGHSGDLLVVLLGEFCYVLVMTRQPVLPVLKQLIFFLCVCEIVSVLFSSHRC